MAKRTQRRERRRLRAYKFFNHVLKATLGAFLRIRYNVHLENHAIVKNLKPPYLLLPNHMSYWDPFILGAVVPDPVYFVASDAHFRSPLLNFLLGMVGAIPKTKVMNDSETIRSILSVRRRNGVIGVFPEGRRTWDGTTMPLFYSIAKLARMMKIPVVTVIFEGAFLSLPRWTRRRRSGELTVKFQLTCSEQTAATSTPDEIFTRIARDLAYNEYEFQRREMIRFSGRRLAEKIEQVLYACPHCERFGTLFSRDANLHCIACGYAVTYDEYGFLRPIQQFPAYYQTVRSWNVWQTEHLLEYLKDVASPQSTDSWNHLNRPIFRKGRITLYTGFRSGRLKRHPPGTLCLHTDGIVYEANGGDREFIRFEAVDGANVQNNERLEFYSNRTLYSFQSVTRQWSSYSWVNAITILQAIASDHVDELATIDDVHAHHQQGRFGLPKAVPAAGNADAAESGS
ncbi:MAG TPA: lysophospholipid acyltransferase family protein [Spirochaetia bacterium]|nr:lysophospholipid acyltransferase family protein [Spirochaetia bacterium]